jgi:hypothetical protein
MTAPQRPTPYVITKPGGLSTQEHAIHLIAALFTCGAWLIGYALFAYYAPKVRYEMVIPYGADPADVEALRAQMTPQQQAAQPRLSERTVNIVVASIAVLVLAFAAWAWWYSSR